MIATKFDKLDTCTVTKFLKPIDKNTGITCTIKS